MQTIRIGDMITDTELRAETTAFRKALEQLVARFPGAEHISCPALLDCQTTLIAVTTGAFAAQRAIAHILDHGGYSCAANIIEGIGDTVERETELSFRRMAKVHGIDLTELDAYGATTIRTARASRPIRVGDMITDADLLAAVEEELRIREEPEEEEEEDVNTRTRNDILRMIKKTEERDG